MLTVLRLLQNLIYNFFSCPLFINPWMSLTPEQEQPKVERLGRQFPILPPEVWLEIFEFSTYVHHQSSIVPLDPFIPRRISRNAMGANSPYLSMRTKLALVLVSKHWRRITLRLLYRHLEIRSLARANRILIALQQSIPHHESYGHWTRHIEIFTFTRHTHDIRYLQVIYKILELCPELRILSGSWTHPLHVEFLNGVARLLGQSLPALYWKDAEFGAHQHSQTLAATSPEFLGSFQALRAIDLRNFVGSDSTTWSPFRPTLPRLKDLILSTRSASLKIATFLIMPSLQNLTLQTSYFDAESERLLKIFLNTHGGSLRTVDFPISPDFDFDPEPPFPTRKPSHAPVHIFLSENFCPKLDTITFPVTSPPIEPHVHPTLRRIGLRGGNTTGLYPDKPSDLRDHLMAVNLDKYPRLELIQIIGFLVEAHSDTLIKDIFIWWADKFEKEMGVTFLDGEGVLWQYDLEHQTTSPPTLQKSDAKAFKLCE